jgi:hypothetical protein
MGFPVLAVERCDLHRSGWRAQAPYVHIHAVRVRPWDVKGFDAADLAELMLRNASVEGIACDGFVARQQLEMGPWHDQVQEARHPADGAIAVFNLYILGRFNFKLDCATMTATCIDHGKFSLIVQS